MAGFSSAKKSSTACSSREIELGAIALQQIGETVRLKPAHERAADQPAMAGDKNLVRFVHGLVIVRV